ncbi:MAG TPA: enoyl-CoA hydratase/isomerase family protein [Acidimicrobiia bacterium]|nr:enoyl-CoA hydratase/isomerase family protein [Acidimicrobiia bacterium]
MAEFETVLYEEVGGVAWITLNRPDRLNAFNFKMQEELQSIWRDLRRNEDVRCAVLTGAGDKAFCTGIDRYEAMGDWDDPDDAGRSQGGAVGRDRGTGGAGDTPWHFDDPGDLLGPKANDLWKPVIAAVNGMACGGAFYMLGEVEFIVASENATFFDPHVTYGMTSCFESMHMLQKMPFHEIMRVALLGANERMSAQRAREIGLVSEVVPLEQLHDATAWVANAIAAAPPVAIQGTVRSIWAARELSRMQALDMGRVIIRLGSQAASLYAGQQQFASGKRVEPRIR